MKHKSNVSRREDDGEMLDVIDLADRSRTPFSRAVEPAIQEQRRRLADWLARWRSFLTINEAILLEAGVTPREFVALLEIDRSDEAGGPTIGMLADSLHTRHNTSVGLVTMMCRKGYVRRARDSRDRRHAHVQLTDKGRQILDALVRAHFQRIDESELEAAPAIV